ncbi:DNA-directed DNA polymerase, family A, palm domain containing protein [uncultured Caudovirales phage]|uniref:DNA-directed DNA polymerase, family A, palm domain containing protein n=1 Tax=uncultured Caudovirales phage TaxID=2100421 RepID=A0A6J5RDJ9_9CAUD|nr:DNA-directed DNA polymerase, family A, palm domain containing protein [uncultured Caudovirales phage]CAB4195089.1 DNA-directed DNA polymerase, family A, palm domain containing protein [uncultured Caudovirales phage]CAB4205128.1 DNA-directed DNA polymerase, family A, palm domain containing protein [uncultured Caudovirales phage]CAB5238062.1 DNA-directed DNA polymerase, family A, palm domain containing protein [uncultured Caudovirales phage]
MSAPYDTILTIDFETYWDSKEYTLSKMTTEEYIRDPRFLAFGACIHDFGTDLRTQWYRGDELHRILSTYDWGRTAVLAHNAQFDVSILSWRYGIQPAFIFDTLSMGRALRGVGVGNSLAKLASDFSLPPKGKALHSTDGVVVLTKDIEVELADYCAHDVYLCEEIFKHFITGYPTSELRLIDMTLKMYTRPMLVLDQNMLAKELIEERDNREALLKKLDISELTLASNPQFAQLLESLHVAPPMKKSKTTGKQTYALAKNDAMFQALLNGDNDDVRLLCEARLKVKSTTERTRAQRFLDIAQRGTLPVPLSYYGALSGRWTASKGSAINMQNLKRGSFLRKAIMAPEGTQLVVGDLSQIEPRVLAWLSDYTEMLDIFRAGGDPYAAFGAQMFGIPGMTKDSHPIHRQSAKSALLGAGYGLGWASFAAQLLVGFLGAPPLRYTKADARQLGVSQQYVQRFVDWEENLTKMREIPHTCSEGELLIHCVIAKKIIDVYRATAHAVTSFWDMCSGLIETSLYGGKEYTHKCLTFRKEQIILPNGMSLLYPRLRRKKDEEGRQQWVYGEDDTKLYAGKITNNVTQAVARIVMTDGMLRVSKRYPVVGTVHDELLAVAPDEEANDAKTWVLAQMVMEPRYLPGIPLGADGGVHRRYGLAKN